MTKTLITTISAFCLLLVVACSGGADKEASEATGAPATEAAAGAPQANADIDPICEMERDASWTEYSLYKGDSVWFCGEGCKQAFDARPEKYMGTKG